MVVYSYYTYKLLGGGRLLQVKIKVLPGLYVLKYRENISLFLTGFKSKETTAVASWEAESSTMNGVRSDLCRNKKSINSEIHVV